MRPAETECLELMIGVTDEIPIRKEQQLDIMAADTMEALGIPRGSYVVKVNNRRVLDGVMESIGLGGEENAGRG